MHTDKDANHLFGLPRSNKASEQAPIEEAVNKIIQIPYHKNLIDIFDNADEVPRTYLFFEEKERQRLSSDPLNDIIQGLYSSTQFKNLKQQQMKINQTISFLSLKNVGLFLGAGLFSTNKGIVMLPL